ncbi:MAG: diacylglycerol/lipid kinase family protein [bacterium]
MNPDSRKILLIFNPYAAHGRAARLLPEIETYFGQKNMTVETRLTRYRQHAVEIVAGADFSKYDALAAAGGDGTLFEIVNGYFQNTNQKRLPIGVLPLGTGNSFAKDLNLEAHQWREGIDLIHLNRPAPVDVARCKMDEDEFYFINILGLGFVTAVQEISDKLKAIGNSAYLLGVLLKTFFLKTSSVQLELDGRIIDENISLMEISNTRYTGRNFLMAPAAKFNDGLLDVTVGKSMSRLRLLWLFPKIFSGTHVNAKEVEVFKAKRIRIRSAEVMKLGPDGEIHGSTPVQIECLPGALQVFV